VTLPGGRVAYLDFAYPAAFLGLEADSYLHHSTRTAWSRDRVRNNELVALGWRVLPVTFTELKQAPSSVADQVRRCWRVVDFPPQSGGDSTKVSVVHRRRG
jgi:very-short-patch-repair endonuclease